MGGKWWQADCSGDDFVLFAYHCLEVTGDSADLAIVGWNSMIERMRERSDERI
jgi:hypothetical protein